MNTPKRLELKKYNPSLRRHTISSKSFLLCREPPTQTGVLCFSVCTPLGTVRTTQIPRGTCQDTIDAVAAVISVESP